MMKKNLFKMKKDLAIVLSSAMVLSNFAVPVYAAEEIAAVEEQEITGTAEEDANGEKPDTYYTLTLNADLEKVTVKGVEDNQQVSENSAISFTAEAKEGYKDVTVKATKLNGDDINVKADDDGVTFRIAAEDVTEDIIINVYAAKINNSSETGDDDTISNNQLSLKDAAKAARNAFKGSAAENEISVIPTGTDKKTVYTISFNSVSDNKTAGTLTLNKGDKVVLPKYDKKTADLKVNKKIASVNGKGVLKAKKPTSGETLTYKTTDGVDVSLKIVTIEPTIKASTVSAGSVSGNKAATVTIKKLKGTITSAGAFDIIVDTSLTSKADTVKIKAKGGIKFDDTKEYFTVGEDGNLHITGVAESKGSVKIPFTANGKKYTITLNSKIK